MLKLNFCRREMFVTDEIGCFDCQKYLSMIKKYHVARLLFIHSTAKYLLLITVNCLLAIFPQRRQKWGSLFRSTPKAVIVTWYWLWNFERPVFNLLFVQYVSFKRLHHATIRYSPGNFELWAGDENLSFMQWVLYKHQHHVVIQY